MDVIVPQYRVAFFAKTLNVAGGARVIPFSEQ
jgi:hypothetical protein